CRGIVVVKHTSPASPASCSTIGLILASWSALKSRRSERFCIFMEKYWLGAFDQSSTDLAGTTSVRKIGISVVPESLLLNVRVSLPTRNNISIPAAYSAELAPLGGVYKAT